MRDRSPLIDALLAGSDWQDWTRTPLAGDASARQYLRLTHGPDSAILMNAPPENGEDTRAFVDLAEYLTTHGFAAPQVLAHQPENGLLLLSDLGESDYAQWLAQNPTDENTLYRAAADVLLALENVTPPDNLKRMTPDVGAEMIGIIGQHYSQKPTTDLRQEMQRALSAFAPEPNTLALRDYHAENLIWRSHLFGLDRIGLLDFQDAFIAPPGYDLTSLLRDARRDVDPKVHDGMIAYFSERTKAKATFRTSLACLGVQRNLRILGVFARLITVVGKPRYRAFIPRVWGHIVADLQDPALVELKQAVLDTVPAPTPEHLTRLQS